MVKNEKVKIHFFDIGILIWLYIMVVYLYPKVIKYDYIGHEKIIFYFFSILFLVEIAIYLFLRFLRIKKPLEWQDVLLFIRYSFSYGYIFNFILLPLIFGIITYWSIGTASGKLYQQKFKIIETTNQFIRLESLTKESVYILPLSKYSIEYKKGDLLLVFFQKDIMGLDVIMGYSYKRKKCNKFGCYSIVSINSSTEMIKQIPVEKNQVK